MLWWTLSCDFLVGKTLKEVPSVETVTFFFPASREALVSPRLCPHQLPQGQVLSAAVGTAAGAAEPAVAARGREVAVGAQAGGQGGGYPVPLPGALGPSGMAGAPQQAPPSPSPAGTPRPGARRQARPGVSAVSPTTSPVPAPSTELRLLGPLDAKGSSAASTWASQRM